MTGEPRCTRCKNRPAFENGLCAVCGDVKARPSEDEKANVEYYLNEALRAAGGDRVSALASSIDLAGVWAGATEGLFWDDLANALLAVRGRGAVEQAVAKLGERVGGRRQTRTGRLKADEIAARHDAGEPSLERP